MTTAKELTDNLISRAKAMQTFRIMRQLDDADIIFSAGVVPFDLKINKDGRMTATVHAMTLEEANEQVDAWIKRLEQGDDDDWNA
jgi:hypothetical protein